MNFIAFDFETTGGKSQYPCSLGIVLVIDNEIVQENYFLINPEYPIETYVSKKVHGITNEKVKESPTFLQVWPEILPLFNKVGLAVAHNVNFDKTVIIKSCERYNLPLPQCFFECSCELCKEKYPHMKKYNLDFLCKSFDIELSNHHNALVDARSTALLTLKLFSECKPNLNIECPQPNKPKPRKHSTSIYEAELKQPDVVYDNIEEITFEGQKFVFTGSLERFQRNEATDIVKTKGGKVSSSVSKLTNYLIVGLENTDLVNDKDGAKSVKVIQAENFRAEGKDIKIIKGSDFEALVRKCDEVTI